MFGIGIILALSAFISIYVTSIAQQQGQNSQSSSITNTVSQPAGISAAARPTNLSSGNIGSQIRSIAISEGSAAQQVKVYYRPNPAGVSSGSKVTWTNNDIEPHTATSGVSSVATNSGKIFDTGLKSPGSTGSALVTGNGKIPYHCTFHPWMTGTIQITGSNQALKGTSPSQ
jgi:plastocyanin